MRITSNTFFINVLLAVALSAASVASQSLAPRISGTILDPAGTPVSAAHVQIAASRLRVTAVTGPHGSFSVPLPAWGLYTIRIQASGFSPITRQFQLTPASTPLTLQFRQVAAAAQQVIVSAGVSDISLTDPDPSQKVMVREQLLDANPGRPGAPVSIPGMPIETASGGIKAPQYFVPGVAGDHGEPLAQYIAVGGYLVSNNLSANAHGNGYADPNIYVPSALASVATDGGAFNVLEGNHALNLAAVYSLRPQLRRFLTLTGDYRDLDLTAGFAPSNPATKAWLALEANYGNGLMRILEHRQQYKWNAMRVFHPGKQQITLLTIGYWGKSHEGNLVPIGYGVQVNDTLDPRQKDQTHTGLLAANDLWKLSRNNTLSFGGFFRTYNLALFSNFGEGLIRQSEFRTVEGGEARETHTFTPWLDALIGLDYNEDDIHRDNLDHYLSADPQVYGPFLKVLSNNIDIREVAPFAVLHGDLGTHLHFYAGLRHEQIEVNNTDILKPEQSSDQWQGFEEPKATLSFTPAAGLSAWLPAASFSIGQAFFTEDPRISVAASPASGSPIYASPFERSHSLQLVLEKDLRATDFRLTLGHTTTTATLAKIDPDNGLAEDEGPGTLKFLTASLRHQFGFGTAQALFSKADARDHDTGLPAPEAPRTIFDFLTTLDKLPLGLHARGEYEYVGHKLLDVGNTQHPKQFEAIPVAETRLAVIRAFLNGRLELGAESEIARGYTGQTTETMAPGWTLGKIPYCAPGSGPTGLANDFGCGTNEQPVGIRMVSWAGGSIRWRFGPEN